MNHFASDYIHLSVSKYIVLRSLSISLFQKRCFSSPGATFWLGPRADLDFVQKRNIFYLSLKLFFEGLS
jgi:hypothetical protein